MSIEELRKDIEMYETRENVVADIAKRINGIGKTGMMKAVYFLQQVYKVPLGFDFRIYTYGPYADGVLTTIDDAEQSGKIDVKHVEYPNGKTGYAIHSKVKDINSDYAEGYSRKIDEIANLFGEYTARQWELAATIVYVYVTYKENEDRGWVLNEVEVKENVKRIKPHFDIKAIEDEYGYLSECGVLEKAVAC